MTIQTINLDNPAGARVQVSDVNTKLNANFSELDTRTAAAQTAADNAGTAAAGKYAKPSAGIPAADLDAAVQTSLGKADSAVQPGSLGTAATHAATDFAPAGSGTGGAVTATDVGLGNVNNTSDANKPVSTAQATADAAARDAAISAVSVPVAVSASRALIASDSGRTLTNATSSSYSLSLIAGLGSFTIIQGSTGTLTVTAGTAAVSGTVVTTATRPVVRFFETAAGVYVGVAVAISPIQADPATGALDASSMSALAASGINVQLRNAPYLTKGNMCGRLTTAAIAADHTSQHAFTFETAPGYLRVLVGNNLSVALTNIKVAYAALPTAASTDNLGNASITGVINGFILTPSPQVSSADMVGRQVTGTGVTASTVIKAANGDGTYTVNISQTVTSTTLTLAVGWVNIALAGSTTWASVAAGSATHTVDNPNYTTSDWAYEVVTNPICIDRQDGGTLPIGVVRIEVPVASNANIPVSYWATTTAFETEGDANTAPWGRFYRCRIQSVLGVTNKALFTSTTMNGQVVPIIIQYVPRDMAAGASVLVVGNSIDEGVNGGATARRPGWMAETQARVSTTKKPLEIVNVAIHGAASSRYADRITTMAPLLKTEIISLPWYNINSATVDGSSNQAAIDIAAMLGQFNIARVVLDAYNQTFVIPTGLPSNYAARHVVEQDKLRLARNAQMMALPDSPRIKKLDIATPFSGAVDANGQTTIVSGGTSDGLHDSDAGRALMATPAATLYGSILKGAV